MIKSEKEYFDKIIKLEKLSKEISDYEEINFILPDTNKNDIKKYNRERRLEEKPIVLYFMWLYIVILCVTIAPMFINSDWHDPRALAIIITAIVFLWNI